jgi:hypothetical protein
MRCCLQTTRDDARAPRVIAAANRVGAPLSRQRRQTAVLFRQCTQIPGGRMPRRSVCARPAALLRWQRHLVADWTASSRRAGCVGSMARSRCCLLTTTGLKLSTTAGSWETRYGEFFVVPAWLDLKTGDLSRDAPSSGGCWQAGDVVCRQHGACCSAKCPSRRASGYHPGLGNSEDMEPGILVCVDR